MKVLLLTTCICDDPNIRDLANLIMSVNRVEDISFEHLILLQNSSGYCGKELLGLSTNSNYNLRLFKQNDIISLSKSRNILISNAQSYKLFDKCCFVSFPDDDCWYPANFWKNFFELEERERFDLFYTRFSSEPLSIGSSGNAHTISTLIKNASSNTTFYRAKIFKEIGFFDESFGVGSKNNGGEDLDFAIRAMLISDTIFYCDLPTVGHRDHLPEFRYKYYQGSFGVLKKHKMKSACLFYNFFRKLLVGFVFFVKGNISLSDFKVNKN